MDNLEVKQFISDSVNELIEKEIFDPAFYIYLAYLGAKQCYAPKIQSKSHLLKKVARYCDAYEEFLLYQLYEKNLDQFFDSLHNPIWRRIGFFFDSLDCTPDHSPENYRILIEMILSEFQKHSSSYDVYQPSSVTELVLSLVGDLQGKRIYNPYFGNGDYLLKMKGQNFIGQESFDYRWQIGVINLDAHEMDHYRLHHAVPFVEHGRWASWEKPNIYDVIVSTPPFRIKDKFADSEELLYADEQFILRGFKSLSEQGIMAGVFDAELLTSPDCLALRQEIIKSGILNLIILLPKHVYTNGPEQTVALFFDKRNIDIKANFIDATDCYKTSSNNDIQVDVMQVLERIVSSNNEGTIKKSYDEIDNYMKNLKCK